MAVFWYVGDHTELSSNLVKVFSAALAEIKRNVFFNCRPALVYKMGDGLFHKWDMSTSKKSLDPTETLNFSKSLFASARIQS